VNKHYERAIFNMAKQDDNESYEGYFDKLRELISSCQYGKMKDELLLDKIIYSIKDENLRENREITLTQAINKCKARELTEYQLKSIRPNEEEINKIQQGVTSKYGKNYHNKSNNETDRRNSQSQLTKSSNRTRFNNENVNSDGLKNETTTQTSG
jgi:hypothetical protein